MLGQQGEQSVAQQCEVGQRGGVARARTVFAPNGIATPVVADFDATPMATHQLLPLRGRALLRFGARQIVARLGGGLSGLFHRDLAAHHDDAAGEGEVDRERFEDKAGECADFYPAVAGRGLGKKRASGSASHACACASSPGWLPLIWSRYSPPFSTMGRAVAFWQCSASAVTILPSSVGSFSSSAVATVCSQRGVPSFWS